MKILKLLFFISVLFITNSSHCQTCDCTAINVTQLKACLDNTANVVICVGTDFSLDDPLVTLPLVVHTNQTLQGDYSLIIKPEGTLVYSSHKADYCYCYNSQSAMYCPGPCELSSFFLFVMEEGSTIQNLRIQGAVWNYQDYNDEDQLCGGIFIQRGPGVSLGSNYHVNECEIYGFNYAGIFTDVYTDLVTIEKSYIHHVKGKAQYKGIGYGQWVKSQPLNGVVAPTRISFLNNIYDDCKAAIDGQGFLTNWTIENCSFTQYFYSEEVNKHNNNTYSLGIKCTGDATNFVLPTNDNHIQHTLTTSSCSFWGLYCDHTLTYTLTECPLNPDAPKYKIDEMPTASTINQFYNSYFPIHDVGGANTSVNNSIFHKKWTNSSNGQGLGSNINLNYPMTDVTMSNGLIPTITINDNTFATDHGTSYLKNYGGYARIADNYIESCPWNNDPAIVWQSGGLPDNSFSYLVGTPVAVNTGPQPPEATIALTKNGSQLPQTPNQIHYVNSDEDFDISISPGTSGLGGTNLTYIIRPNPSKSGSDGNNNAANNHFWIDQSTRDAALMPYNYKYDNDVKALPGLYGIDYLAIDKGNYHASSWQHEPIIVVPPSRETMLVFNIKDSYYEWFGQVTPLTNAFKQARLNGHIIWSEDMAFGGDDWERVEISLTNNPLIDPSWLLPTQNVLSFHIAVDPSIIAGIDTAIIKGVTVWVDDVYINKYGNFSGENLILNADVELESCLGSLDYATQSPCWWYASLPIVWTYTSTFNIDEEPEDYDPLTEFSLPLLANQIVTKKTDIMFSINERKSGNKVLSMKLPQLNFPAGFPDPTYPSPTSNQPDAYTSIFTNFNFLQDCANYGNNFTATSGNPPGDDYDLNNSLVVNGYLSIVNSTIDIAPSVAITVPIGSTLEITNSHFFACGAMWQGIINDGGTVIIDGSTFEDANSAVKTMNNGRVNIRHNTFNHNYTSLWFEQGNYDVIAGFNNIYGNTFDNTGGKIIKSPHAQEDPFHHIFLNLVTGITIGNALQDENIFHNSINGIYAKKSNLKSFNNTFNNIGGDGYQNRIIVYPIASANAAINVTGDNLISYYLVAGGSNTNELNRFNECEMGILIYLDMNINVTYNLFNLCKSACQLQSIKGGNIIFKHNSVDRFIYGIALWDVFSNATVLINQNYFNQGLSYDQNNYGTKAISLQNYSMQGAYYDISENTIANCEKGIHLRNIAAYMAGPAGTAGLSVKGNLIETMIPNIDLVNPHYGIWIENCFGANIINNTVNRVSFGGLPSYTSTALQQDLLRGISIDKSDRSIVKDNYTENMGTDIRVLGHCLGTELQCNRMKSSFQGIKLVSAKITTLPQIGSLSKPTDNTWEGNYIQNSNERFLGNFDDGLLRNYYHRDFNSLGVDPLNLYCPYYPIIGKPVNPVNGATGTWNCNFIQPVLDDRDEMLMVSTNQVQYDEFEAENQFYSKQFAYEALSADSTLMYTGNQNDIWLQQFYLAQQSGNSGRIKDVKDYIAIKNKQLAQMNNLSIVDSTIVLQNLKWVNGYYLDNLFDVDSIYLDTIVLPQMEYLAQSNGIQGGEGVYYARAILGIDVEDAVNVMRIAQHQSDEDVEYSTEQLKIFPNPAKDKIYVSYLIFEKGTLSILDGSFRKLKIIDLDCNKTLSEVDVSGIVDGFYYCIIKAGNYSKAGKLTIVK